MFTLNEFVSRDNVPENDRTRYRQMPAAFEADLQPVGALEVALAADMLRCTYLIGYYSAIDPATLPDDSTRHLINVRHNAAVKSFRWSTNMLRKTQTDREIGSRVGCRPRGIASVTEILKATNTAKPGVAAPVPQPTQKPGKVSVADMVTLLDKQINAEMEAARKDISHAVADLKKQTQFTPRNASCTCGSGEKFKRCCGKDAPPVPGDWLRGLKNAA